ncbi:hypothetical protein KNP414_03553 [Paenibacillus mucilaginosus KNP414]|uniref:Uncharacterized protein n=1 Tax=Paenibacillus mucilaginosus (strain KNP414) TaxID=1036673 RepID=F8FBD0_PAEMK|nr:hypothetical protein KNP414_03553 [Paenibacillus mucilaginosus KNP414]
MRECTGLFAVNRWNAQMRILGKGRKRQRPIRGFAEEAA